MLDQEVLILDELYNKCNNLLSDGKEGLSVTIILSRWGLGIIEIKEMILFLIKCNHCKRRENCNVIFGDTEFGTCENFVE